jgi:hypothetical protein
MRSVVSPTQEPKPQLSLDAQVALGKVSPQLAWVQVEDQVGQAIEEHYEESEQLRLEYNLPIDLTNLTEILAETNPVRGVSELQYINQNLDLKNIPKQKPLEVLKAVLRMLTESDHYLAPKRAMEL